MNLKGGLFSEPERRRAEEQRNKSEVFPRFQIISLLSNDEQLNDFQAGSKWSRSATRAKVGLINDGVIQRELINQSSLT